MHDAKMQVGLKMYTMCNYFHLQDSLGCSAKNSYKAQRGGVTPLPMQSRKRLALDYLILLLPMPALLNTLATHAGPT